MTTLCPAVPRGDTRRPPEPPAGGLPPSYCPVVPLQAGAGDLMPGPWLSQGRCGETDPDAFFPGKGGSTREAKKVCWACEVRDECLEWALATGQRFGVWGGLSERERRRLKRGVA